MYVTILEEISEVSDDLNINNLATDTNIPGADLQVTTNSI